MLARAIVRVTACHPAQNGSYFLQNMRFECIYSAFQTLRCWNHELARECSDISAVQGQSSIMHLCEMRLIVSV